VGNLEVILRFNLQIPLMEKCEKQMSIYAETGGSPEDILPFGVQMEMCEKQMFIYLWRYYCRGSLEVILLVRLQIPTMEKFQELIFPFAETGGSPEEILQFGSQMPKLENAVKHMYAVAVDQCNK
jgi:hypothetical protein